MEKGQREFFLRQQLKAIQDELGEGDPEQAELAELRERVEAADLPEEARKAADRELAGSSGCRAAAAEYGVIRTYLDWILSLPWGQTTADNLDLRRARRILDEDHYGLDKVKERIVEYLAVSKLKNDVSGPILCFVGPPGVGKTSLGQSVARALERQVHAHLGGRRARRGGDPRAPAHVHRGHARDDHPRSARRRVDEPGVPHRRDRQDGRATTAATRPRRCSRCWIRARTGRSATTTSTSRSTSRRCSSSAPRTSSTRSRGRSSTGWTSSSCPATPRRRSSASRASYLVPRQIEAHGLEANQGVFTEAALRLVISGYTREAGVRGLERRLADLCRKAARQIARGEGEARADRRPQGARAGSGRAASGWSRGAGPRSRASRQGSRSRRSAATCSSSRRRDMPGRARSR